ncbi:hypothetical protein [Actinotalea solisilvae]|uniref:hypothetical protein n=1 Tax=Actinotalea solisilvae TaxID=2072922 RepID=UPI0018F1DEC9|nr:hypothetical protein [Actinotalea solisilvae]
MTITHATSVQGEPGVEVRIAQRRRLPVSQYMSILGQVNQSLLELDLRSTSRGTPRLTWGIADLGRSGAELVAQLAPVHIPPRRDATTLSAPPRDLVAGIRALGTAPEIPEQFSAQTVERILSIGRGTDDGTVDHITVTALGDVDHVDAVVTHDTIESAKTAVRVARSAWGSVTGELTVLDNRGHRNVRAQVYDAKRRQAVVLRAELKMAGELRDAWGKRVAATGTLTRNAAGQPLKLDLAQLVLVETQEERISPWSILGVDAGATGHLTTEEFMEMIRGR